jgi:acylphosphatase
MADTSYYNLHLYVSGRVQGVGFRFFAINRASTYGVTGWVKNLYDGRVEIEAEGKKKNLLLFLEDIRIGPRSAYVSNVLEKWHDITAPRYTSFDVGF